MGCDPTDVEFLQGPSNLAQLLLGSIAMMDGPRCDLKQAGLVGVDRYRTPMLLDIVTQLPQVLLGRIVTRKARRQLRGSIIDHPQVELLALSFQPVVPLHQLAITCSPCPPYVGLFHSR